jgi:imidazolonepropionase-like amidohydrolase
LLIGLPGAAQTGTETVVFEGARLIDGTGRPPVEGSVLIVTRGSIRAMGKPGEVRYPKGARVVDLRGKTIMPTLTNLHGHLGLTQNGLAAGNASYTEDNIRAQLAKYLAYGVGSVLVLGTDQEIVYELREAQRAGNFPGARLFTAGRGFGVVGGYPPGTAKPQDVSRPKSPDEARAQVRELASHHPNFVKIWVDDDFGRLPKMKPEIYRAIIEAAHRYQLRVIAHVFYLADAKALLEAGIDGLGHSIRDLPVDHTLIDAMKARGVFLVPTLVRDESTFIYAQSAPWLEDPFFQTGVEPAVASILKSPSFIEKFRANPDLARLQAAFEMARKNLRTLADAGVKIGLGTDSGPPLRFQGYFEHRELQLMVESGLTPMQAIVAATSSAAEILGSSSQFGTLEPGKQADFLVLDANPLADIHNTEKLSAVYQSGRPVHGLAFQPAAH